MATEEDRQVGDRRAIGLPVVSYFNRRFGDLFAHVTNESSDTRRHVTEEVRQVVEEDRAALREASERIAPGVASMAEAAVQLELVVARLEERLHHMVLPEEAGALLDLLDADAALAQALAAAVQARSLADLPEWVADVANWLGSHRSPLADAGLWLNNPVTVRARPGGAEVGSVNERIVEVPWVFRALGQAPPGPVLDIGCAESTVSLSTASLGRRTYALDPRGYPFSHPMIEVVQAGLETWSGPDEPLALAVSLSTIEHLGVGSYSQERGDVDRADHDALARVRDWLLPDGMLVLTAPYGRASVDELQRVYDAAGLERLLDGYDLVESRFARRSGPVTWEVCSAGDLAGADEAGVALVTARVRR